jgi:hypothetical protein
VVAHAFARRLAYCAIEISFEKHIPTLSDAETDAG